MSTRERPRKNKKKEKQQSNEPSSSDSIEDWLDSYDDGKQQEKTVSEPLTDAVTTKPSSVTTENQHLDQLLAEFTRRLPKWINKPWMYVKPTHEGHLNSWYDAWKKLVLDYCEILTKHIINIYDLHDLHPFTHRDHGKDLSIDEIQYLVETMVDENLAKWLDNETIRARIYYKPDEEWADIIYNFTIEEGYALEVMTLYELRNLDQPWSSLPLSELKIVLELLVNEGKAEWVGEDKEAIQFVI